MSFFERFWSKVSFARGSRGCWLWTGQIDSNGYGTIRRGSAESGYVKAHRATWAMYRGEIPGGMCLDHVCRVRNCVRPDHLEVVTPKENYDRGIGPLRRKTHCKRGHELSGCNIVMVLASGRTKSQRTCKQCVRLCQRKNRAARKAAMAVEIG